VRLPDDKIEAIAALAYSSLVTYRDYLEKEKGFMGDTTKFTDAYYHGFITAVQLILGEDNRKLIHKLVDFENRSKK